MAGVRREPDDARNETGNRRRRSKRGVKPELDDRVVGVTIGVQVEVQGIDDLVVEVEEVRARRGHLGRDHVHDEDGLARILPAPEGVDVGDVGRRVERDERRLPVAGRPAQRCAAEHHKGGERRGGDAIVGIGLSHHLCPFAL